MFKIAKLENVNNENVDIKLVSHEYTQYQDGKKILTDSFNTLSFDISGDNYSFGFDLNCRLEKLLEIPMNEQIDFNSYIFFEETLLNVGGNWMEPDMDIKVTRYLRNKFIVFITFFTNYTEDNYSGVIEFTFNLDDYLG